MTAQGVAGWAGEHAGSPRPCLDVQRLSKTFGATRALSDVDMAIQPGHVHALLGENGSGKSTLIKTLSGYFLPDDGSRVIVGAIPLTFGSPEHAHRLGLRFVHQDLGLVDTCSVADNLALVDGFPCRLGTIRQSEHRRRAEVALARLGLSDLDPSTPVGRLAPAVRTGVAVARALGGTDQAAVSLLVLDEPTAALPAGEVRLLLDIVRAVASAGVGVLYVSHHIDEVFEVADDVTVLRDGRRVVTTTAGALTRAQLINHLIGGELDEVRAASDALPPEHGEPVLRVLDLYVGPLRSVSFEVCPGDVVGIAGVTGSGREAVLPAIFGALPRAGGSVTTPGGELASHRPDLAIAAGVALLPSDRPRQGGIMALSARENITLPQLRTLWGVHRLHRRREVAEARDWFKRLDVRPVDDVEKSLASFSGGNQQKVLFAKWLRCEPKVLLLDEPTQGVDIGAKAQIHRQVLAAVEAGAAAIVSSSDYDELVALCHRVLVVRGGVVVADLAGAALTVEAVAREAIGREGAAA